ncbi:MAG TPA: phosphopantetheine-binding protein [Kineosporiaceae bacterium]
METTAMNEQRLARIRVMAAEHLEVDPETLTMTTDFARDCGADSLVLMDFRAALEEEFEVTIAQQDWDDLLTLERVYQVLADLAGW